MTSLSIEWNLIRIGDPVHRIVAKTVHKTLSWGRGGPRGGWIWGYRGGGDTGGGEWVSV